MRKHSAWLYRTMRWNERRGTLNHNWYTYLYQPEDIIDCCDKHVTLESSIIEVARSHFYLIITTLYILWHSNGLYCSTLPYVKRIKGRGIENFEKPISSETRTANGVWSVQQVGHCVDLARWNGTEYSVLHCDYSHEEEKGWSTRGIRGQHSEEYGASFATIWRVCAVKSMCIVRAMKEPTLPFISIPSCFLSLSLSLSLSLAFQAGYTVYIFQLLVYLYTHETAPQYHTISRVS